MIYVTSDTHYNHGNIIRHCDRTVFENRAHMNCELIDRWNSMVGPDDVVWHLGDVAWGARRWYNEFLNAVNGQLVVIFGNHDRRNYIKEHPKVQAVYAFEEVHVFGEAGRTFHLTHVPDDLGWWQPYHRGIIRLCGHVHNALPKWISTKKHWDEERRAYTGDPYPCRVMNMSVEHWDYTPVPLDQVIEEYDAHFAADEARTGA